MLEHGSILAAAEATDTSQPTLSRRMRELEDSLGVLLINRSSKGVRPTVYGLKLKQHAEKVLLEQQSLLDDLRAMKSGTRGHARIGMAPAFSGYLPAVIQTLSEERAGASFEVVEGTYDALVKKTLTGEIQGAFTMLPAGESVESLAVKVLGEEPVLVVVDADHPLSQSGPVQSERLKGSAWIVMNRPRSILDAFHELAESQGMGAADVSIETSSLDFLKSMLNGSNLLAALPKGAVYRELSEGSIAALDVGELPKVQLGFVHQHGVLSPVLTQVLERMEMLLRSLS